MLQPQEKQSKINGRHSQTSPISDYEASTAGSDRAHHHRPRQFHQHAAHALRGRTRRSPGIGPAAPPMTCWCRCHVRRRPRFVDVLHAALAGSRRGHRRRPYSDPPPATILRVRDTSYVESAQADRARLTDQSTATWRATHTRPRSAARPHHRGGRRPVVLGLGRFATTTAAPACCRPSVPRPRPGPWSEDRRLAQLTSVELDRARRRVEASNWSLPAMSTIPLLGITGATRIYRPQKG